MSGWLTALADLDAAGIPHVLVTQVEVLGSAPREAGAKMVVTSDQLYGSIGGGSLEFQAAAIARGMLVEESKTPRIEKSILGPDMRQCCGGAVTLLFEPFHPAALRLALFGAGHVAKALIHVLEGIPLRLTWIDERPGAFPEQMPGFVRALSPSEPLSVVPELPPGTHVLVMTHSHDRDFQLVRALAERADLASLGLIGSETKWSRFRRRLAEDGLARDRIDWVRCPIGLPGLKGKRPAQIAIAIAAQLLIETSEEE